MSVFDSLTRSLPPILRPLLSMSGAPSESARRLAEILDVDPGELPALRLGNRLHYRRFLAAKPDGRERRLLAPSPALKRLQRRLLDHYLAQFPTHPCATAFSPGSSIVHNARRHSRSLWIATVDLRDFFESTRAARVRSFFARQGWRDEELRTLTRLCVYHNGLPQGAPTSPCLSNLVNIPLDERLHQLCQRSQAIYTRYGDDLTFSWRSGRMPDGFRQSVEDHLAWAGYAIQPLKGWRVIPIAARPIITGIALTGGGRLGIPWPVRRRLWLSRWQSWWGNEQARARRRGYEGYSRMVKETSR